MGRYVYKVEHYFLIRLKKSGGTKNSLLNQFTADATGQTLDEAFHWSSALEESCQIALAAKLINEPFIEHRKNSDAYGKW